MAEPGKDNSRNLAGRDYYQDGQNIRGNSGTAVNQVEGNFVQNVLNFFWGSSGQSQGRIEDFLLKTVKSEVSDRLSQSLHERIYIELDKERDRSQIFRPWDMELKTGLAEGELLPQETKIETIFDRQEISGRLLILGAPGSGKTTTLLELAKVLLDRAEKDAKEPVPVLLNLSSWKNDKQAIDSWMADSIKTKYYGVPADIGLELIEKVRILPLLDGLDELASDRQELCASKINEFSQQWQGSLVVCSRIEEYQSYATKLRLSGSVILRPLRNEQIRAYLLGSEGDESLWQLVEGEPDFLELARIPLMLNIMVVARSRIDFQEQQPTSSEMLLPRLFDAYIDNQLAWGVQGTGKKPPSPEQARRWLTWLAGKLIQENETEFLIEKIQPYWLDHKMQRLIYRLIGLLIYGLIGGLIGELTLGLIGELTLGITLGAILVSGLILGLISELIGGREFYFIKTAETIVWSNINKRKLILGLIGLIRVLIGVIILGLIGVLIRGLIRILIAVMIGALIGGLFSGLIGVLTESFVGAEIENKTTPNQGIRQSFINIVTFSIISYLPSVSFLCLIWKITGLDFDWFLPFVGGLGLALFCGINQSRAFIEHFALRLVLWWNGYAPWNYARFLDYATKYLLMQRVGGGYRFLHDLLRKHFARL